MILYTITYGSRLADDIGVCRMSGSVWISRIWMDCRVFCLAKMNSCPRLGNKNNTISFKRIIIMIIMLF